MSLVRLENISKTYAGREILDSIDFRVEEGEHVGLATAPENPPSFASLPGISTRIKVSWTA
jgi:hypothetical protein